MSVNSGFRNILPRFTSRNFQPSVACLGRVPMEGRGDLDQQQRLSGKQGYIMAGCEHYVRKCSFLAPCCNKIYPCRFCHDASEESHELERKSVKNIVCNQCGKMQDVVSHCVECGIKFGFYFCSTCRLYDDKDKGQFHCDLCGICRVGGKENFFHCIMCDMCYPNNIRTSHKCIEKSSRSNCPICMEDMHSSTVPCQILRCGHLLHQTCFQACLKSRLQQCPLCSMSMV